MSAAPNIREGHVAIEVSKKYCFLRTIFSRMRPSSLARDIARLGLQIQPQQSGVPGVGLSAAQSTRYHLSWKVNYFRLHFATSAHAVDHSGRTRRGGAIIAVSRCVTTECISSTSQSCDVNALSIILLSESVPTHARSL